MKRTDMLRKERELKRARKKEDRLSKGEKAEMSVGDYINELSSLFFHDENKIYNIDSEEKILELLEDMKDELEERHWESVIRKAVKKTKVAQREEAAIQLLNLL